MAASAGQFEKRFIACAAKVQEKVIGSYGTPQHTSALDTIRGTYEGVPVIVTVKVYAHDVRHDFRVEVTALHQTTKRPLGALAKRLAILMANRQLFPQTVSVNEDTGVAAFMVSFRGC